MITSTSDLLTVLGIAIALSAYLSAIRLAAIQKITEFPKDTEDGKQKRWAIKKKLGYLTLADAPMVAAAFLLGVDLLWERLFCGHPFCWLLPVGIWASFSREHGDGCAACHRLD
jgi:hypothetical protein